MIPFKVYSSISCGWLNIPVWWLLFALAFLAPILFIHWELGKKKPFLAKKIIKLLVLLFFTGAIGGRLAYVIQFPQYYFSYPLEIFKIWQGGLAFYGGLLASLLTSWFYLKKYNLNFWQVGDLLAPLIGLGIFITRIGCSLINDHQGSLTSLPWGILWPDGSLRHPVAEYLALNGLLIFGVLLFLRRKYFFQSGQIFLIFLLWYPLSRFLLDFTRVSDTPLADPRLLGLANSQWISLGILFWIFGGYLIKKVFDFLKNI